MITSLAFSQKEASNWYFGYGAGLNFDASGGVSVLTNGQLNTSEGCATVSDASGNLMFYTDGTTVYNSNHQVMVNGTGLFGNWSSTQSSIIVPKPDSVNLYYIFTIDVVTNPYGFCYSIVDMNLDGGLGAVTNDKNVLIYAPSCEKIAVTKHANNNEYWIVTHGWENNTFYSYSLSSLGLNAIPVVSNTGSIISFWRNTTGFLKFSPNGNKLASCNSLLNSELFDFDKTTGVISNPLILNAPLYGDYGLEFSSNSEILYVSGINTSLTFGIIKQFDLTASDIPASVQTVYSGTDIIPGALQMGINGKIYFAQVTSDKIGVINNPEVIGSGCNVTTDAIYLAGKYCGFGLPTFVSSLFNASFTVQNLCLGSTTQFTLDSNQTILSALWDFGDGVTSNTISPSHQYNSTGNYTVSVIATNANGTTTKTKTITIAAVPVANLISNQTVCGDSASLYDLSQHNATLLGTQSNTVFGVNYFVSLADLVNNTNVLPILYNLPIGTTTLYAKVYNLANSNCYAYQSFTITKYLKPISTAVANKFVCDDASNDGLAFFDLDANTTTVLGTQSATDFKVTYHTTQNEATTGANPLSVNYQNTSNPQTLYIRVENKLSSSCFDASQSFQIGLYKLPKANQPSNLYLCDAGNDGIETFDLAPQNSVVLGSQLASDYTITYHNSQNDANLGVNTIGVIQTIQNTKTIYVRIENKLRASCFDTAFFELTLKPKPVITMDDSYTICQGKSIVVTAPIGFSSYLWSNGSNTNTTTITQAGNYSLTVTKNYGTIICDETKNFIVYNSNIATIASIETHDWTDNENDIAVFVTDASVGDYEYSLDNIHFQDSNQFYGLMSGDYVVYVRDKKGCGTAYKEVFLLMYPKFFTPNGDGFNDVWKIKFSNNEPNLLIYIYDRYGKFVKMLNGLSSGWNGTLTGENLPSDDYWFVVKRENGKEYKGHFTLKR